MLQLINKLFLKAHTRAKNELDSKAASLEKERQHTLGVIDDLRFQLEIAEAHEQALVVRRQATLEAAAAYDAKVRKLTDILK